MNLKEAFRYQTYLDTIMGDACDAVSDTANSHIITKTHLRSRAADGAEDIEEVVENSSFIPVDNAVECMKWVIAERKKLSRAINKAKADADIDIDAAVESNKFRRRCCISLRMLLDHKLKKRTEQGKDYRFNAEGNQMPYYYDIEVVSAEAYDREAANRYLRELRKEADETSTAIDAAMVNTVVDYEPRFDVNERFEDIISEFGK